MKEIEQVEVQEEMKFMHIYLLFYIVYYVNEHWTNVIILYFVLSGRIDVPDMHKDF